MANLQRHIKEGWTPQFFIDELSMEIEMIQTNNSWKKPLKTKAELKAYCIDNQPYYKKYVPEVVNYFATKYSLK